MSNLRAAKWTQLVPEHVRDALATAWPDAPYDAIAILMSQIAVETGWAKCVCWNLGNVKGDPTAGYPVCSFVTKEVLGGVRQTMTCTFRAFDSLDEGVAFYLGFLRKKFAPAWSYVLAGDVAGFNHALKIHGYYTADEAEYLRGLLGHYDQWRTPSLATAGEVSDALQGVDVRTFQRLRGLTPDGLVGPATRRAIREMLARSAPTMPPAA